MQLTAHYCQQGINDNSDNVILIAKAFIRNVNDGTIGAIDSKTNMSNVQQRAYG